MSSFEPSRIPAWLAPVCDDRSVSHSASACEPSVSQRAMFGALPSRIARCSTGRARPSISRKTMPGASVETGFRPRRAILWMTRNVYVSSSFDPATASRITPTAAATSATPSADQKESTVRSPFVMLSAANSIRASTTRMSRNPVSSISGRCRAATSGGSTALRIAITSAATSAPPKLLVEAPGTIQAAARSAAAERSHATSSRTGWMRGRAGAHATLSP